MTDGIASGRECRIDAAHDTVAAPAAPATGATASAPASAGASAADAAAACGAADSAVTSLGQSECERLHERCARAKDNIVRHARYTLGLNGVRRDAACPPGEVRTGSLVGIAGSEGSRGEAAAGAAAAGAAHLSPQNAYVATALSLRDLLLERMEETEEEVARLGAKRVCYLSMEFLVGRILRNALLNLSLTEEYSEALRQLGHSLEEVEDEEVDPALGNGGLGRLASCFLDSLASLSYPAWGYGIRYRYGMLRQEIRSQRQVELPDLWLGQSGSCPWEIHRPEVRYPVRFFGYVMPHVSGSRTRFSWEGGELVHAVAYDIPIPGFGSAFTNNLRLWKSEPVHEFDLAQFNAGRHTEAMDARSRADAISSVLYPDDGSEAGKELRLKQEFFLVSATLQDILARHAQSRRPLSQLPDGIAVQMNDTHPSLAIPELMRLLLDIKDLEWDEAWSITERVCGYTNHTIMPEALERWPVPLMQALLPRHMDIIFEINHRHLMAVAARWQGEDSGGRISRMSIIEESHPKMVRMAVLATVGSHAVNGVAELHTELVKSRLLPDFVEFCAHKFQNKTNGVTHRRWLLLANPWLSEVITRWLGSSEWITNFSAIHGLLRFSRDQQLHDEWRAAKQACKNRLAAFVRSKCGVTVDSSALFDVQVKRLHEYKRQLLNILSVIHRYNTIKGSSYAERQHILPRVVIFSGKAAPGYLQAKCVIHLINAVADRVNSDADIGNLLRVVFIPNYNVSVAEVVIPASDVSQHISTAGMEASGTSNMKFAINGGLILGTMDGANIEIADAVGRDNLFTFGALSSETDSLRHAQQFRQPVLDDRLQQVLSTVESGVFGPSDEFRSILDPLRHNNDYYLIAHDWPSYLDAQQSVDRLFEDRDEWTRRSIISTASMGRFSSDRTVQQYAKDIWKLKAVPIDFGAAS